MSAGGTAGAGGDGGGSVDGGGGGHEDLNSKAEADALLSSLAQQPGKSHPDQMQGLLRSTWSRTDSDVFYCVHVQRPQAKFRKGLETRKHHTDCRLA